MNPNEKIVVYRDGEVVLHGQRMTEATPVASYEVTPLTIDESSAEVVETAWLHDKIIFKEEPFSALAKKIERQYNVEIQIDNDEIRNQLLTGKFEDEDLEESLSVLQMIVPFNYTIQGNTVKISP